MILKKLLILFASGCVVIISLGQVVPTKKATLKESLTVQNDTLHLDSIHYLHYEIQNELRNIMKMKDK
jgi:hypothetical protein